MFGRETRMLLTHYLERGTSKSALARKLGVHATRFIAGFAMATSIGIWMGRPCATGRYGGRDETGCVPVDR